MAIPGVRALNPGDFHEWRSDSPGDAVLAFRDLPFPLTDATVSTAVIHGGKPGARGGGSRNRRRRILFVNLHVANDGVGISIAAVGQSRAGSAPGGSFHLRVLEGDSVLSAARLQAAYESTYQTTSLGSLGTNSYGFPMTAKIGGLYVTLTEAGLKDYGDLAVRRGADGALERYFTPIRAAGPQTTRWFNRGG